MKRKGMALFWVIILTAEATLGPAPSAVAVAAESVQVGYAVVTPVSGSVADLKVSRTFGFSQGSVLYQSNQEAQQLVTDALLFVSVSERLGRNLGLAITNPDSGGTQVSLTLFRKDGLRVGFQTLIVPPRQQVAEFITQVFAGQPAMTTEFEGTVSIRSPQPVGIVALRFLGPSFTTELPALSTPAETPLPLILPGIGGTGAFLLPNFVQGSGWATEIVLINTGNVDMTVRIDLFTPNGDPLVAQLDGVSASTFFNLHVRAHGTLVVAQLDISDGRRF